MNSTPPKRKAPPRRLRLPQLYGCTATLGALVLGFVLGVVVYAGLSLLLAPFSETAITQTALARLRADLEETAIGLAGRSLALDLTNDANAVEATQNALVALGTLAALNNEGALLAQTATQSARFALATRTADALNSAQQMTQVALDYAATQARLMQNATQVEIDFRATRAALDRAATAVNQPQGSSDLRGDASAALLAAPTTTPTPTLTSSPAPTNTPSPTLPPAATNTPHPTLPPAPTNTPTPLPSPEPRMLFDQGAPIATWDYRPSDWTEDADGLRAARDEAALRLEDPLPAQFEVVLNFTPALTDRSTYTLRLREPQEGRDGLALRLRAAALTIHEVTLLRLRPDGSESALAVRVADQILSERNRLVLSVRAGRLTLLLNDLALLDRLALSDLTPDQLALRLPAGARLNSATLLRLD